MDNSLYNTIIYNISKGVKKSLNEDIQNFNPVDYTEDEQDIIDSQNVNDILGFDYNTFNDMAKVFQSLKIPKKLKPFLIPFFNIYKQDKGYYQDYTDAWEVIYIQQLNNTKLPAFFNIKDIAKKQNKTAIYKLEVEFSSPQPYDGYDITDEKREKCISFIKNFLINDIENNIIDNKINNLYYDISPYSSNNTWLKVLCTYVPINKIDVILNRDNISKNSLIKDINDGLIRIEMFLNRYITYLQENMNKIKRF